VRGRLLANDAGQEYNIYKAYADRVVEARSDLRDDDGDYDVLSGSIATQIFRIVHTFVNERYLFGDERSHDLHAGNFRITPEGKVVAVGDFTAFAKIEDQSEHYEFARCPEREPLIESLEDVLNVPWMGSDIDLLSIEKRVMAEDVVTLGRGTDEVILRAA
jgi:hypothetical protein